MSLQRVKKLLDTNNRLMKSETLSKLEEDIEALKALTAESDSGEALIPSNISDEDLNKSAVLAAMAAQQLLDKNTEKSQDDEDEDEINKEDMEE